MNALWASLIPIIAKESLAVAELLVKKWQAGKDPTLADFDELRALSSQNASAQAEKVITDLGLTPDKAEMIRALVR